MIMMMADDGIYCTRRTVRLVLVQVQVERETELVVVDRFRYFLIFTRTSSLALWVASHSQFQTLSLPSRFGGSHRSLEFVGLKSFLRQPPVHNARE